MRPLFAFLRRVRRLHRAERALLAGEASRALAELRDPALALSVRADRLRERALDQAWRLAARRAAEGRDASAGRLVADLARDDPDRAARWLALGPLLRPATASAGSTGAAPALGGRSHAPESSAASSSAAGSRGAEPRMRAALTELCGRLRCADPRPSSGRSGPARPLRFHLAVDDGGELLVVAGAELVLGHARGGAADLPLLADVERRHARLARRESFHGGAVWHLAPLAGARVAVGERGLGSGGAELTDGDTVRLASNLALRFRAPDPASGSAVLELLHGAECAGANRVLLLAPGSEGRAGIGSTRRDHVTVADLLHGIELELDAAVLVVRCAGGVRVAGAGAGEARSELRLACPPAPRADLLLGARPATRAPFGLCLRAFEDDAPAPERRGR